MKKMTVKELEAPTIDKLHEESLAAQKEEEMAALKLKIAGQVYTELIGQAARGQRLVEPMMPVLATTAIKCAEAFIQVWNSYDRTDSN